MCESQGGNPIGKALVLVILFFNSILQIIGRQDDGTYILNDGDHRIIINKEKKLIKDPKIVLSIPRSGIHVEYPFDDSVLVGM